MIRRFPPSLTSINVQPPSAQQAVSRLLGLKRGRHPMDGAAIADQSPMDSLSFGRLAASVPVLPNKPVRANSASEGLRIPAVTLIAIPLLAGLLLGGPVLALTLAVMTSMALLVRALFAKSAAKVQTPLPPFVPAATALPETPAPCLKPVQPIETQPDNPFSSFKPVSGERLRVNLFLPRPSHPALAQGVPLHQLIRPVAFILMDPHEGKARLMIYRPATRQFQMIERPANFLSLNPSAGPGPVGDRSSSLPALSQV